MPGDLVAKDPALNEWPLEQRRLRRCVNYNKCPWRSSQYGGLGRDALPYQDLFRNQEPHFPLGYPIPTLSGSSHRHHILMGQTQLNLRKQPL